MRRFLRIGRAQFLPVILSPVLLGTAVGWHASASFNPFFLLLALLGSALLQLAANIINDVYDYVNGVDKISDRMFPPDFPGWKVIPRGLASVGTAKAWAYLCYAGGLLVGVIFLFLAGPPALLLGTLGILVSYFYVAPPVKAAYRGLGLGEMAIFVSFGPIPALGAYYVQTLRLENVPVLASIPLGLLTACVLMNHDLIFHDPYKEGGKRSLTVVLGRVATTKVCVAVGVFCYLYVALLAAARIFPTTSLAVLLALPVFAGLLRIYGKKELQIPDYAKATQASFMHSVSFGVLLSVGFFLG